MVTPRTARQAGSPDSAPPDSAPRHPWTPESAASAPTLDALPAAPTPGMSPWVPIALAIVSALLGAMLTDVVLEASEVLWSLVPTGIVLCARGLELVAGSRLERGSVTAAILVAVHALVTLAGTLLNPFLCIYAFSGYLDAERYLRGRAATAAMVATGLVSATGQVGGIPGVSNAPGLLLALGVVNVGIAAIMTHGAKQREAGVAVRERAVAELAAAHARNVELQQRLLEQARVAGIDEERARLSREIHDTVAQGLVGVIRQLEAVDEPSPPAAARIALAEETARECLTEARRAVQALAPQQLQRRTLAEALHDLTRSWARAHRIVAEVDTDAAPDAVSHAAVLLRVAQESLSNVARHSGADTVRIVLDREGDAARLRVADDGTGFDEHALGHGLRGMVDRVRAVGGTVRIDGRRQPGSMITATVPA